MPEATILQDCPLCGTLATFQASKDRRFKHFLCVVCIEFLIAVDAETDLLAAPKVFREMFCIQAQAAADGEVVLIGREDAKDGHRLRGRIMKWPPQKFEADPDCK